MNDYSELKKLAEDIHGKGTTVEMLNRWARFEAACKPELILALIAENAARLLNSERYMVLRQADVDTIHNGGLFAGLTPDNIVINGSDLDERVDAVLALRKAVTP